MIVRHRDLDPVEAAVPAAARRLAEGAHEFGNLLGFQLVRDVPMNTFGDLRRRQEDIRLFVIGLRTATEVSDLGENQTSVIVHGVGNRAVRRDDGVVVIGDLLPRRGGRRIRRGLVRAGAWAGGGVGGAVAVVVVATWVWWWPAPSAGE